MISKRFETVQFLYNITLSNFPNIPLLAVKSNNVAMIFNFKISIRSEPSRGGYIANTNTFYPKNVDGYLQCTDRIKLFIYSCEFINSSKRKKHEVKTYIFLNKSTIHAS